MNMEVNEINYKKIYNVAECAGITNFDMTDGANRLDVYTKIKNWINSDNELKNLFTAEVVTLNESNQYYCVRPVSYTHLDVYKRQPPEENIPCFTMRSISL